MITIEHVRQAIDWAIAQQGVPGEIAGVTRKYAQDTWDCGTTCCIWGAATLLATGEAATTGPVSDALGDGVGTIAVRLMWSSTATPEHIRAALNGDTDENGNWHCVGCVGCRDCAGCVGCRNCVNCVVCVDCRDCADCVDCVRCVNCVGCVDCRGYREAYHEP